MNGLGVIYRKVNGIPDDIRAYRTNPELSEQRFADGFLRMFLISVNHSKYDGRKVYLA